MIPAVNTCVFVGNTAAPPRSDSAHHCRFRLAVDRNTLGGGHSVTWISVVADGDLADYCLANLSKGTAVHVEGELRTYSVVSDTGQRVLAHSVHARKVQLISA